MQPKKFSFSFYFHLNVIALWCQETFRRYYTEIVFLPYHKTISTLAKKSKKKLCIKFGSLSWLKSFKQKLLDFFFFYHWERFHGQIFWSESELVFTNEIFGNKLNYSCMTNRNTTNTVCKAQVVHKFSI